MEIKRRLNENSLGIYLSIPFVILGIIFFVYFFNFGITGFAVYTQSDESSFDEGTYSNTEWNGSAVILSGENLTGTYTSKVFDAGANATWNNISWDGFSFGELEDGAQGVLMSNNVLLLHMNDDWEDSSGENNNGVASGAIFTTDAKLGSSAGSFDGVEDYVDFGNNGLELNEYTFSGWIKTDTKNTEGIFEWTENSNSKRNVIWLTADGYPGIMYGNNKKYKLSSLDITDGEWHNIIGIYDGSSAFIYVDGVSVSLGSELTGGDSILTNITYLGRINVFNEYYFDGELDEIAVWNRSLSESEIKEVYKKGALRLNLSVRSCNYSLCSGESWEDINDDSPQDLSVDNNQYFQYKINFTSPDSSISPSLESVSIDYELLNTAPVMGIVSPSEGATYGYNESISLDFYVYDNNYNLESCWYNVDDGENINITDCLNTTFDVPGNGVYTLSLYANDSFGEESYDSIEFEVQIGAPTIIISNPVNEFLNYKNNISFTYTPTDIDLDSCELWGNFDGVFELNQTDNSPVSGAINEFVLDLDDGIYLWNVRCNDTIGNIAFSGNNTFYVDTLNPILEITEPSGEKTSRTGVPLEFSVSDENTNSCWYNVYRGDSVELTNHSVDCLSSTTFDVTVDADFTLNLYANDSAGNSNSISSNFSVDTSTLPSSPPSSGGGGGGSSSSSGGGVFNPIIVGDISDIIADEGESKKLSLNVENSRVMFLDKCKVSGDGEHANWFTSSETKGLSGGENYDFFFTLNIPEELEAGIYDLSVKVVCEGFNKTVDFNLEILEKKLLFDLIEVERDSDNSVKVTYSIEEVSNIEQNVELQFLLFDADGNEITEVRDNKVIAAGSKKEFETSIPIDSSVEGELSLLINLNSETYSSFVQENILLSSPIGGYSIFGDLGESRDNIIAILLGIAFLVFAFFTVRRMIKSKKKKKK